MSRHIDMPLFSHCVNKYIYIYIYYLESYSVCRRKLLHEEMYIYIYIQGAVAESVKRGAHMCEIGKSFPSRIKSMTDQTYTVHVLAWYSALFG